MTDAEKIAAFDDLSTALTNQWYCGKWSWWNPTPACGTGNKRETQAEAVADLITWARAKATKIRKTRTVPLLMAKEQPNEAEHDAPGGDLREVPAGM